LAVTVRPMGQEDLQQVAGIDREAFSTQWPPTNYTHELRNQLARYVVACDGGEAAAPKPIEGSRISLHSRVSGWLRYGLFQKPYTAQGNSDNIVGFAGIWVLADESHITNIAVRKTHQRRGIGELLLQQLIEMSRALKAANMTLEVRVSNYTAQALYRKYGFTEVGLRKAYYTDNREDGLLMSTEDISSDSYRALFSRLREAYQDRWKDRVLTG